MKENQSAVFIPADVLFKDFDSSDVLFPNGNNPMVVIVISPCFGCESAIKSIKDMLGPIYKDYTAVPIDTLQAANQKGGAWITPIVQNGDVVDGMFRAEITLQHK